MLDLESPYVKALFDEKAAYFRRFYSALLIQLLFILVCTNLFLNRFVEDTLILASLPGTEIKLKYICQICAAVLLCLHLGFREKDSFQLAILISFTILEILPISSLILTYPIFNNVLLFVCVVVFLLMIICCGTKTHSICANLICYCFCTSIYCFIKLYNSSFKVQDVWIELIACVLVTGYLGLISYWIGSDYESPVIGVLRIYSCPIVFLFSVLSCCFFQPNYEINGKRLVLILWIFWRLYELVAGFCIGSLLGFIPLLNFYFMVKLRRGLKGNTCWIIFCYYIGMIASLVQYVLYYTGRLSGDQLQASVYAALGGTIVLSFPFLCCQYDSID